MSTSYRSTQIAKKNKNKSIRVDNQWSTSYGDMVSLLLVFFIVLYSMMIPPEKKKNATKKIDNQQEKISSISLELKEIILNEQLQESIVIDYTPMGANLRIKDKLLFESGSDQIHQENINKIRPLILELSKLPDHYEFMIEGHTDNIPIPSTNYKIPTNWHLSVFRAMSMLSLFKESNIDIKRIGVAGYSDLRPIADNSTLEGRSENRRIEIKIHSSTPQMIHFSSNRPQ